jgi:dTDP-4-amino-4,6-dideoxygalactose transaminase
MDGLGAVARRHGLRLFEDAAQAHGATRDGARAGSLGDAAAFSFYPSKNLGALGDAGGICTDDDELARRARSLRDLGQVRKGKHVHLAGHDRLDALQAAFLSVKLPHLDTWNAARRRHASRYRQLLGPALGMLREDPRCVPNYHVFPVLSEERDACLSVLHGRGIAAGVHYTPALHRQRALARFANPGPFPEAERWARTEFSLPMFAELRKDEIQAIAAACAAALPEGETREHATV